MALVLNSTGAITASSEDIDFGATTAVTAKVYQNANSSAFTATGDITVNGTLTIV
jgi:hypothetical protein